VQTAVAILVIAVVYAIGDFISNKTKAFVPMMFTAGLIFLVGFWVGLPLSLFEDSKIPPIAMAFIPMLMVHMGSFMKLRDLKEEWKTVATAILALILLSAAIYLIGSPVIGSDKAVTAVGPISGGVVSTLIVSQAAKAKGLAALEVFATLLLVLQSFVGLPIASFCLKREGKRLIAAFRSNSGAAEVKSGTASDPEVPTWKLFPALPTAMRTPFILVAKAMFVGWLATSTAVVTKGVVHPFIIALVFGIILYEVGFIEHKILDKANSGGLTLFIMLVPIFMSLSKATPKMVLDLIFPTVVVFVISAIGLVIAAFIISKFIGYSWEVCLAIGSTCLFGFPGTYFISQEVADSLATNKEEREFLIKKILPKMLIAGFTTVTIFSVVLAGFIVKLM